MSVRVNKLYVVPIREVLMLNASVECRECIEHVRPRIERHRFVRCVQVIIVCVAVRNVAVAVVARGTNLGNHGRSFLTYLLLAY